MLRTTESADLPWFRLLDEVLDRSDLVVIGATHSRYRSFGLNQPVIDTWNLLGRGGLLMDATSQ